MINKRITAYLSNNITIEGIVSEWNNSYIILRVDGSPHQFVINNPEKNLILFKILNQVKSDDVEKFKLPPQIEYDYSDLPSHEADPEVAKLSLKQLKHKKNEQFRKDLAREMNKFHNAPDQIGGNFASQTAIFKRK